MKEKQQLIKEIKRASDELVKKVLNFLLLIKSKVIKFDSSEEAYDSCNQVSTVKFQKSLKSLLLEIPEVGEDADFARISDTGRDIEL